MARILALGMDVSVLVPTLLSAGHEVVCTCDGDAAVRLIGELKPHIVLADSDMGGLDLCLRVRGAGNKVYFLLVSNSVSALDLQANSVAGVDDWMAKPLSPRALLEHVETGMQVVARRIGAL